MWISQYYRWVSCLIQRMASACFGCRFVLFFFLTEVCAYLSSEPINPSAHTAYAGFSSLAKLAALYVVPVSNGQLHFIECLLIGPHDVCLSVCLPELWRGCLLHRTAWCMSAAGTVARLLTARVSKPKLSSVIQQTSNHQHIRKTPRHERSSGHRSSGKERLQMRISKKSRTQNKSDISSFLERKLLLLEICLHCNNKILLMLNQAPLIEDVWKSDSITPRIPDLSI
jgi:hypothetical protein